MTTPGMAEMIDVSALNSKIKFDKMDVPFEQREILGDATETGLARFAGRQLPDYDEHLKNHPKVFEVPFNSTNKWALVTGKWIRTYGSSATSSAYFFIPQSRRSMQMAILLHT